MDGEMREAKFKIANLENDRRNLENQKQSLQQEIQRLQNLQQQQHRQHPPPQSSHHHNPYHNPPAPSEHRNDFMPASMVPDDPSSSSSNSQQQHSQDHGRGGYNQQNNNPYQFHQSQPPPPQNKPIQKNVPESLKRKFVPPKKTNPSNSSSSNPSNSQQQKRTSSSSDKTSKEEDEELPEELKHLDPELCKSIMYDIMSPPTHITFDSISGLKSAKDAIFEMTEFLVQLDGTKEGTGRVLLIGATNRPAELDDAARRRFVKRLYIPLPDTLGRTEMINSLLKGNRHELGEKEVGRLASKTDGFSGADLKSLCNDASMGPIRELGKGAMESSSGPHCPSGAPWFLQHP
ncbi:hypothetical protein TrRE_jg13170 [Triparma retinervis]|uniref:Uncharacterized protein n=1 Tax=Triparma retinervis TaxID=2557542 RepID=A0A9W6ZER0_9STRA|nr:hypothetical protein TrRE_jg13170 [Triparma retinervis]